MKTPSWCVAWLAACAFSLAAQMALAGADGAKPSAKSNPPSAAPSAKAEARSELKIVAEAEQTEPATGSSTPVDEKTSEEAADEATADTTDEPAADQKYDLKYQFHKGETIRWKVEHRSHVDTTVQGTTQTAESLTYSVKVWKVRDVDDQGNASFEHSVESLQMRQKVSGRQEVSYDSLTDKIVPPVFQAAAASVGVPLTDVTVDVRGKITRRKNLAPGQSGDESSQITILLPERPVAIGEQWYHPLEVDVSLADGAYKKVQMRQAFTLEDVRHNVAILKLETQVLTPINDPAIEAQLMQRETSGEVRFDIEAGRLVGQRFDLDRKVLAFQGQNSSLHCRTRFSETLLDDAPPTALNTDATARPVVAGPEPPPRD
jgi:hypothetical protein